MFARRLARDRQGGEARSAKIFVEDSRAAAADHVERAGEDALPYTAA